MLVKHVWDCLKSRAQWLEVYLRNYRKIYCFCALASRKVNNLRRNDCMPSCSPQHASIHLIFLFRFNHVNLEMQLESFLLLTFTTIYELSGQSWTWMLISSLIDILSAGGRSWRVERHHRCLENDPFSSSSVDEEHNLGLLSTFHFLSSLRGNAGGGDISEKGHGDGIHMTSDGC